jgi:hypothetical protein
MVEQPVMMSISASEIQEQQVENAIMNSSDHVIEDDISDAPHQVPEVAVVQPAANS